MNLIVNQFFLEMELCKIQYLFMLKLLGKDIVLNNSAKGIAQEK